MQTNGYAAWFEGVHVTVPPSPARQRFTQPGAPSVRSAKPAIRQQVSSYFSLFPFRIIEKMENYVA